MYKLNKKKPVYIKLQERIMVNMENNENESSSGKKIISLISYMEHYIKAREYNKNIDSNERYHKIKSSKKGNKIVAVSIQNKYDTSYVSSFFKHGIFTIINLRLLSEEDRIAWYNEMDDIIKFYGKIEYIEPDLYALVPFEVSYIKDTQKINRLK